MEVDIAHSRANIGVGRANLL